MAILSDGVFAFYWLLILLILAPLPFGSILPWAQSFLTFGVFALLASWAVRPGVSPATSSQTAERGLGILLALWALAVAFAFLQVLPLPPGVLAAMSPALRDLYGWALPDYWQSGIWRSLSTTPGATIESGLLIGVCGTAFFLVGRQCRSRERAVPCPDRQPRGGDQHEACLRPADRGFRVCVFAGVDTQVERHYPAAAP